MIAFALLAIVACASAAPRYKHDHHFHHHDHDHFHNHDDTNLENFMTGTMFDTRSFWEELRKEMMGLTTTIEDLRQRFPTEPLHEKIEGNEYKITISLTGFKDTEIAVKARKGLLIVEAVHKVAGEPERSYLDLRTLPDFVDVNGSWTYDNGLLKIVFPVQQKSEGVPAVTQAAATQAPEHSYEVTETVINGVDNEDADIGIRKTTNEGISVSANEIPQGNTVEATTYAVDLKDEVELVPINY